MKHQSKLSEEQQQQQQQTAGQQTQPQSGREFASAEEMLRYDAEHTVVPPEIALRLEKSIGNLPGPKTGWWRRLLGGSNP
jgi:transcription initiation factor TFIID subunit TAF12